MISSKTHLFIIGAQKAGTTWLQHELDSSDEFFLPPDRQEVQFFGDYSHELAEYSSLYQDCREWQVSVDVTPVYLSREYALDHILDSQNFLLGGSKYIVILREPVARAFSAYQMYLAYGRNYSGFIEALDGGQSDIADKSMYGRHLRRWCASIKKESLKVLFFDDILTRPDAVLNEIANFLGLKCSIVSNYAGVPVNAGGVPRHKIVSQTFWLGGKVLRGVGLASAVHTLKQSRFIRALDRANKKRFTLDRKTEALARSYFAEDIDLLDSIVGLGDMRKKWGY